MPSLQRVCVFCGSSAGTDPRFAGAAREVGRLIAQQGMGVVYGGARVGLMGIVADAVLAGGGEAVGVLPRALQERELAHAGLSRLHIVESMHERKALMADLADAFIALPGGFGTLDEFCEVLTWAQLGIHAKPCGLLNVAGFFDPFLEQVSRAVQGGLMRSENRALIVDEAEPARLLARMQKHHAVVPPKWLDPSAR